MGSRVQELLEMLHSMITEAWGIPLGAEKCVIERDKALDLLDEIRAQFPHELAEAKRLVGARTEFVNNAKREAESIKKAAEERVRSLLDEQGILKMAKAKSAEMIAAAEASSNELRRVANEYVDDALKRSEEALVAALEEMRQSRVRFRNAARGTMRETREVDDGLDIDL